MWAFQTISSKPFTVKGHSIQLYQTVYLSNNHANILTLDQL